MRREFLNAIARIERVADSMGAASALFEAADWARDEATTHPDGSGPKFNALRVLATAAGIRCHIAHAEVAGVDMRALARRQAMAM